MGGNEAGEEARSDLSGKEGVFDYLDKHSVIHATVDSLYYTH